MKVNAGSNDESAGAELQDFCSNLLTSISQAEYTTMSLGATPRAIVVGSQTAGADGNVAPIMLPTNMRTGFGGLGVYNPDRAPTQRVGVKIDVPCVPTIAGIRAGRDEVLECALEAFMGSVAGRKDKDAK